MVTHETYRSSGDEPRWLSPERSRAARRQEGRSRPAASRSSSAASMKMSKSKKNVVDPDEIVDRLRRRRGALVHAVGQPARARPAVVRGRASRAAGGSSSGCGGCSASTTPPHRRGQGARPQDPPGDRRGRPKTSRRSRFNKAVARIYELTSAAEKAAPSAEPLAAIRTLLLLVAPMMPHLAEEGWAAIGERGLIAEAAWPPSRSGAAGRGRSDHRGAGDGQAARYADRRQGPAERGAGGACACFGEGPACAGRGGDTQGDRGARPAGQSSSHEAHRRPRRLPPLPGAERLRPVADVRGRRQRRRSRKGSRVSVDSRADRGPRRLAGAQRAHATGSASRRQPRALPARRDARRQARRASAC